jgi:sugar transferase (PEP-CTERM/EpsH1 system associated)
MTLKKEPVNFLTPAPQANQRSTIKIFHFITELSIGGAQVALYNLVSCLDRERYEQAVICLYNGNKRIGQQIIALGIPVYDLEMRNKFRLDAFWRLYQLLGQSQPDILYTWMFHANIPGRIIGRLVGIHHIISSEHTMGQEGRGRRWLNRLTSPLADRIICVSHAIATYATQVIGIPADKLVVIPNGIDLEKYTNLPSQNQARTRFGLPQKEFIIGAIGRLHPVKGYSTLLQAFIQIARERLQTHLLFVGEGPDRQKLAAQAARAGLSERVTFLENQVDIPGLLPGLDVLAMPSLHEGLGIVAIEAMAAGLPVVGTRVGGIPEVVIDGESGLLTPPSDAQALAEALLRLINDPDLRKRLGLAGRAHVYAHFSQQTVLLKTENLFSELLSKG